MMYKKGSPFLFEFQDVEVESNVEEKNLIHRFPKMKKKN